MNNKQKDCQELLQLIDISKKSLVQIIELLEKQRPQLAGPHKQAVRDFVAEMKKILKKYIIFDLNYYYNLSKIDKSDFKENWRQEAAIYREIMWAFLDKFSNSRCEMTHSEFSINDTSDGIKHIYLCAEIFEGSKLTWQDFGEYLKQNIKIIPQEIRQHMVLYMGYNYGQDGGIRITASGVDYINQKDLENQGMDTDGAIGTSLDTTDDTESKLHKIYKKVQEELELENNK